MISWGYIIIIIFIVLAFISYFYGMCILCDIKKCSTRANLSIKDTKEMQNNIYNILSDLNIEYKKYEHTALHTVADADAFFDSIETDDFWKNKNLFLRNDKKDKYILVTLHAYKRLDIKAIAEVFGEKRLSFASDEELMDMLGLKPGSVSPFGLVNDIEKKVVFAVDDSVFESERVIFHPNINTTSLEISIENFKKYLKFIREDYISLKI